MEGSVFSNVRLAQAPDRNQLAKMRTSLWPDALIEEHLDEPGGTLPTAVFVAHDDASELIGFLEVGLRSHADGCDTARPVGFVEGWFVQEGFRTRGVGRALMRAAEEWARAQGCVEMASDTLIDNPDGQLAHQALGFEIVDRCVHYRKNL
jgi:aminoglycoside 6'-N-acetyltransferase I